jgi:Contractile injection system tube protein
MNIQTITLIPEDGEKPDINFMFNPSEIKGIQSNKIQDNTGANNLDAGTPKPSFGVKTSNVYEMKDIIFDTYEEGRNVLEYIIPFQEGMKFIDRMKRPPVYRFVCGSVQYMRRCFIQDFSYTFTKFLPDGTPVRAVVNVSLKEAEDEKVTNLATAGIQSPNAAQRGGLAGYASLFTGVFFP